MQHLIRAARLRLAANLCFFACILGAIACFAFAVSDIAALPLYIAGGVLLVLSAVLVATLRLQAAKQEALGREETAKEAEPLPPEDGLSAAFCDEIRAYSVSQLRLIVDEQREEYSEKEFAFIQKILAEKQATL